MLLNFVFSTLFSAGLAAAVSDGLNDFPQYKEPVAQVYDKLKEPEEKPNDINRTFLDTVAKKTNEISKYAREKKDEFMKMQKTKREEMDAALKKELSDWKAANPQGNVSAFMRLQGSRRKEFVDKLNEEKNIFEINLDNRRAAFNNFVNDSRKDFSAKFKRYVDAYNAAKSKLQESESGAQSEFKQIPKGQGTVLTPEKEPKKQ